MENQALLEFSPDDLLEIFGRALSNTEPLRGGGGADDSRSRAKDWILKNNAVLCKAICVDFRVHERLHSRGTAALFGWVCEILTDVFTGIPVGALSAYLVVIGIDAFCKGHTQATGT